MGALVASPEAGDASVNTIPHVKKCSAIIGDHSKSFVSTMSEKDTINPSGLMPASHYINIMNKSKYEQMLLMENSAFDEMSSSTIHDNCQFPYYRLLLLLSFNIKSIKLIFMYNNICSMKL